MLTQIKWSEHIFKGFMLQAFGVIGGGVFSYRLAVPWVTVITHFSLFPALPTWHHRSALL